MDGCASTTHSLVHHRILFLQQRFKRLAIKVLLQQTLEVEKETIAKQDFYFYFSVVKTPTL